MPVIRVNGDDFFVKLDGPATAPVLLLSNSLSSDLSMWDDQVPVWAQRFRVVRYDQRGHGSTVVSAEPYSMDQLGRDAIGVMDALGIKTAHWWAVARRHGRDVDADACSRAHRQSGARQHGRLHGTGRTVERTY